MKTVPSAPDQAGEPVAWMRDAGEESLSTMAFCCSDRVKKIWLKANPSQVERYTIPLYAAPPANAPVAMTDERIVQIFYPMGTATDNQKLIAIAVGRAILLAASMGGEKHD